MAWIFGCERQRGVKGTGGHLFEINEEFVDIGGVNRFEWSKMECDGFRWLITVVITELAIERNRELKWVSGSVECTIVDEELIWIWAEFRQFDWD